MLQEMRDDSNISKLIEIKGYRARKSPIGDRKSTRLNSSHGYISYAVFCLKKKKNPIVKLHWDSHVDKTTGRRVLTDINKRFSDVKEGDIGPSCSTSAATTVCNLDICRIYA